MRTRWLKPPAGDVVLDTAAVAAADAAADDDDGDGELCGTTVDGSIEVCE